MQAIAETGNLLAPHVGTSICASIWVALILALALAFKSILSFSHTGPQIREQVLNNYKFFTAWSIFKLSFWAFAIFLFIGSLGCTAWASISLMLKIPPSTVSYGISAIIAIIVIAALKFCQHLLYIPSGLTSSWQYRVSRLYPLWNTLSPMKLEIVRGAIFAVYLLASVAGSITAFDGPGTHGYAYLYALWCAASAWLLFAWARPPLDRPIPPPPKSRQPDNTGKHPNILMIGADTLRADRVANPDYPRELTPNINKLAENSTVFRNCYVPLARTAPSLTSILTGTWPQRHGIRDNYVADDETELDTVTLPRLLKSHGYTTATVSDWAGADLGKIDFGFDIQNTPPDQWNIKYYLSQGPMDLRLVLSLFSHNTFGRRILPQIFFLAGTPLNNYLEQTSCQLINSLSAQDKPFLLNLFTSTTHAPFGSEYPYYLKFAPKDYMGESKFIMTKLNAPEEIIDKQQSVSSAFDIPQIFNLYDSCVSRFDELVATLTMHLDRAGLAENTIIVIYSDHGSDFFENESWGQGNTVIGEDPSARIPLIIYDPRRPVGQEINDITRSVDIAPTLAELANIDWQTPFDGVSLQPFMNGCSETPRLSAYQETGIWLGQVPGLGDDHLGYPNILELIEIKNKRTGTLSIKERYLEITEAAKDKMVRTEQWKLVRQPLVDRKRFLLFDIISDPGCKHDVAQQHPDVVAELQRNLEDWEKLATPTSATVGKNEYTPDQHNAC